MDKKGQFLVKYDLIGDTGFTMLNFTLKKGESIMIQDGAMAYMHGIDLIEQRNSNNGGFWAAAARSSVSGESMYIERATATEDDAILGIASNHVGTIKDLVVGDKQYCLNDGAFLACETTVAYHMKKQSMKNAMFGGTGGRYVMETEDSGLIFLECFASLIKLSITKDYPLTIDNHHVVAWDNTLSYETRWLRGSNGKSTSEGLVLDFYGDGDIYIETK